MGWAKGRRWLLAKFGGKCLLIAAPILVATHLVRKMGEEDGARTSFKSIQGNDYVMNSVLLYFILAGLAVLLLSLILYAVDVLGDVFNAGEGGVFVRVLRWLALLCVGIAFAAIIIYLILASLCFAGETRPGSVFMNFQSIFDWNKRLSLGVFVIFLILDLILIAKQYAHMRKLGASVAVDQKARSRYLNNIRLSWEATIFINVPSVIVTWCALWLTDHLSQPAFWGKFDRDFRAPLTVPGDEAVYRLFVNGLETGVIVASILVSQIIFAAISLRWSLEDHSLAD